MTPHQWYKKKVKEIEGLIERHGTACWNVAINAPIKPNMTVEAEVMELRYYLIGWSSMHGIRLDLAHVLAEHTIKRLLKAKDLLPSDDEPIRLFCASDMTHLPEPAYNEVYERIRKIVGELQTRKIMTALTGVNHNGYTDDEG